MKKINALHVVGKSHFKEWPTENRYEAWRIFCSCLHDLHKKYNLTTRAFVLMSNHYHWLCEYDRKQEGDAFEEFHENLNSIFLQNRKASEKILGFYPVVVQLDNLASYRNTYKYIYRNPVSAGVVFKAEDYSYSTLRFLLGHGRRPFHFEDNMNLIYDPVRLLNWINSPWGEQLYFKFYYERGDRR